MKNKIVGKSFKDLPDDVGKSYKNSLSLKLILPILLLIGFGLRLYISWLDIDLLFQKCLVDDAFFYFGIAKNIAAGNGATFDGSIMTNGFHPIYAFLLVPLFWIFPHNMEIPIHWALTILSVFNVLTGLVIFLIVREIAGKIAGIFASFIWLFNPYVIMISLNGVEVGVATFFISLCIYQYIKMCKEETYYPKGIISLGILTALAILSRVDAVFIFIALTIDILYRSYVRKKQLILSLSQPALFVLTTFVVLSPWLLWNLYNFGTIRQISGVTLPNIAHNMYLMKYKTYLSLYFIKTELFYLKVWIENIIRFSGGIPLFILFVGLLIWTKRKRFEKCPGELLARMKSMNFIILSAILLISFYAFYFWGWIRPWYYLSVIFIVTIYFGIIIGHTYRTFVFSTTKVYKQALHVIVLFFILSVFFLYQGSHAWKKGLFYFQKQLYDSAVWLKDNTEKTSKIGAISAGIYGYMTQRTIDLAGVVNEEAYRAMKEKRFFSYLKEKKINYLVDREDMIQFFSTQFDRNSFMKYLMPVKRFGDKASDIVVYRIVSTNERITNKTKSKTTSF